MICDNLQLLLLSYKRQN